VFPTEIHAANTMCYAAGFDFVPKNGRNGCVALSVSRTESPRRRRAFSNISFASVVGRVLRKSKSEQLFLGRPETNGEFKR